MRIWEVSFQVYDPLDCFPVPGELVQEIQETPAYRIDEKSRYGNTKGGQLSCTLEGEGRFWDNEKKKEYVLTPGKAFFARHGYKDISYYYPPEGTAPWIALWISFGGKIAEDMMQEIIEKHGHIFNLPLDEGVIKRLGAYGNYSQTVQPLTSGAGAKMVMDIFTSLTDSDKKEFLNDPQSDFVRQIRQYMLENIGNDYGVADVADALNLSREHLSRFFSKRMGRSLAEYIRQNKIRRACHLLRETRFSCSDIGEQVGYHNSASFGRVFKSVMGMTPENFRKIGYIPKLESELPFGSESERKKEK